jgi:hypothetical protein
MAFILFTGTALSTDIRVVQTTITPTYGTGSISFAKGGRVGNWINGTGNTSTAPVTFCFA